MNLRLLLSLMLLCGAAFACTPVIGDKCAYNSQCGTTLTCDTSFTDGYCLKVGCRKGDCPAEATCVSFGTDVSYCLRSCAPDNECRDGLSCRAAVQCSDDASQTVNSSQPCSWEAQSFCGIAP